MCVSRAEVEAAPPPAARRRLRLWELTPGLHCAVLGTCMSFADLVKTGRKAGIVPEPDATDYEVHAWFVQNCGEPTPLTRLLHKRLDRRWHAAIGAARAARDEAALASFWSRAVAKGDIPGPFWAVMTHPAATEDLRAEAYGVVHMLSHRMGSANRDASQRLRAAEAERDALDRRLSDAARRLERRARENEALRDRLRTAEAGAAALEAAEARLRAFESGDLYRGLRSGKDGAEAALEETRRDRDAEARRSQALERELAELRRERSDHAARLEAAEAERSALEAMLRSGIAVGEDHRADAPAIDLCGRRIAYVGGRDAAVRHFRALVESANGRFAHHDGGVEDGAQRLDRVLSQADVVLCPIDCVSHSACLRAKKFCKRAAKTFVPLRSASLSALAAGLHHACGDGGPAGEGGAGAARH
ncbi:MAG: DUF2325 domain-containing protein [Defluviicoccus sp.]|nr:DUF2325 domain-containing protein [Defluviicoccus sp.]MDE0278286.1 DUF2325 domain-containing protein [Defluviicoccus sp.]